MTETCHKAPFTKGLVQLCLPKKPCSEGGFGTLCNIAGGTRWEKSVW